MFRAIILPIFRSTRLCVTACYTHDVSGWWPAASWVRYTTSCNTQSSAPEDEQNNFPKHVELTGIINKPLLLHLVGCLYYLYFIIFFWDLLNNLNLNLTLKTWRKWWAPNNACKWQMGFNSSFKGYEVPVVTGTLFQVAAALYRLAVSKRPVDSPCARIACYLGDPK